MGPAFCVSAVAVEVLKLRANTARQPTVRVLGHVPHDWPGRIGSFVGLTWRQAPRAGPSLAVVSPAKLKYSLCSCHTHSELSTTG